MTRPHVVQGILEWLVSYKGRDLTKAIVALKWYPIFPEEVDRLKKRGVYRLVGKERAGKYFKGEMDFLKEKEN